MFPLSGFGQPRSSFPEPVTPPTVDPDVGGLISISFNPAWLPYVLGALTQLTQLTTWSGSDADKTLAVDRATNLLNLVGYPAASIPGVTTVSITVVVRYNSTTHTVETSTDGGSTWVTSPGSDPRNASPLPPQTGVNAACNSAASEVKWLTKCAEMLQVIGGTGVTATALGYSIIGLLVELTGPWAVLLDVAVSVGLGFLSAGLTAINLAFSSTNLDLLECILYCNLDGLNQLDAARLANVESDVTAQIGGTSATILNSVLSLQGYGGINSAMALKLATDTCGGCACTWCFKFDFSLGTLDWQQLDLGQYSSGVGFIQKYSVSSGPAGYTGCNIQLDSFGSITITELSVNYNATLGGIQGLPTTARRIALFTNNTQRAITNNPAGTNVTLTFSGTVSGVTSLQLFDTQGYDGTSPFTDQGGTVLIKSITVKGTGSNPFGADNC